MTQMDRRKFLQYSSSALGGLIASPRLALMAAMGGAVVAGIGAEEAPQSGSVPSRPGRILMRGSEPINASGEPFGHSISGFALTPVPTARAGERQLMVVGHDEPRADCEERFARRSVGISALELNLRADGSWGHDVASVQNRRWHSDTPIALDGERLCEEAPPFRHQETTMGTSGVSCVSALPWHTVLCGERDGYVIEVNALSGLAIKRLSLGRVSPVAMTTVAEAGRPVRVYLLGRNLFKFVSFQRFEARRLQANLSMLLSGELWVGDPETKTWRSLTDGLSNSQWLERMRDPYGAPELPRAFNSPWSLSWTGERGELTVTADDQSFLMKDQRAGALPLATAHQSPFSVERDHQGWMLLAR